MVAWIGLYFQVLHEKLPPFNAPLCSVCLTHMVDQALSVLKGLKFQELDE
jgi:hypothetical protein